MAAASVGLRRWCQVVSLFSCHSYFLHSLSFDVLIFLKLSLLFFQNVGVITSYFIVGVFAKIGKEFLSSVYID